MSEQMRPSFSQNAIKVLERRYLLKDEKGNLMETPEDMLWRVARAVAKAERSFGDEGAEKEWAERFFEMMARLDFLPNSPTLMNAGTPAGQLSACFVLPIGDSMEEIFDALKYTALVHKSGGGTGFNFSSLRPYGDIVKSTKGVASGPVSFMELFDHTTDVVKQGGMRRGANMGILNADHPDVVKFIKAKVEEGKLRNFNISIGATQKFMRAILNDGDWDLVNPRTREVVDRIKARYLFDLICEMAWKTGDPGMIFLDKIEASNPTPHLGPIIATNPCGEQPLLPFESCNLGSINLSNMISSNREIDWNKLEQTTRMAVRFLDDVIEINQFPIKEIADRTKATRKIGLGVMGWADVLFKARIPYDSEDALEFARQVMCFISKIGHEESSKLAEERGPFPAWKGSKWEESGLLMR
ncbi:MAG: adenosylcobalamin-dependent ribonucleoside-diphosphate reductase, partial [Acetomicrobium sp.]